MVGENIKILQNRIKRICYHCGRNPDDIQIVAVSKTFSIESIQAAIEAGQLDFGENYVQELQEKRKALSESLVRWHFIGHLQTNKVKYLAEYIHLIHSVDSIALGKEINKRAEHYSRVQDVLIEVHTTDEATKFGVLPAHVPELVKEMAELPHLRVCGLMTMGPFSGDPNNSRPSFQCLKKLRSEIDAEGIDKVQMKHLSMGMTHDFEVAVEEGATILRIGTAIFGSRNK